MRVAVYRSFARAACILTFDLASFHLRSTFLEFNHLEK